jgi:general secretion pathway protein D
LVTLAGCAIRPKIPPSEGHIAAAAPQEKESKVPQPVSVGPYVPPPKVQTKVPTYTVVVHEVPVKELLFALARDTKQNFDVHPAIQGLVSINAIDETLPSILERISRQVNIRYKNEGKVIVVLPDTPYAKTYKVNYVNMTRDSTSTIGVSGQIDGGDSVSGSSGGGGGGQGGTSGSSTTTVNTHTKNNFWDVLRENVQSILAATRAQATSAEDRQAKAEAARSAREEKLAQAEAVARAGANATNLFNTVFGASSQAPGQVAGQDVVVNPVTGTVTILATEKQHLLVQQYLDGVSSASQRQVLIEATIAEVTLSNNYQGGIDWRRVANSGSNGISFKQELTGSNLGSAPRLFVGYENLGSRFGEVAASLKLLEQFGSTRVLSSPKLMAINNQTALLKVVDNIVYFTIDQQTNQAANAPTITTYTSKVHTVAVGMVMAMTPQINENGVVTLTVRPTISRVTSFAEDPNPALKVDSSGRPLTTPISNKIPQVQVREMESVLQMVSGQTAILGGLMQDNVRRDRDQIPGVGSLPRVGEAFSYRDESVTKTELVIFLRPTIVTNPSVSDGDLASLKRFLPPIDPTGNTP